MRWALIFIVLLFAGPLWVLSSGEVTLDPNWRTADRSSTNIAPKPSLHPGAIVQVYAARAFHWRGLFAVHMWLAVKPKNGKHYTVYEIIGWRKHYNKPILVVSENIPDRRWFNQKPWVVFELNAKKAENAIPNISRAAKLYLYQNTYLLWPGPNSNTFVAYIAREVPELKFVLPTIAIGKDFIPGNRFFAPSPDGTGYQFSFYGLFGLLISKNAGLEINILGLVFAANPLKLAIALPGVGSMSIM